MAGNNFGKQSKREERRDAKQHLALQSVAIDAEQLYFSPDADDCDSVLSQAYLLDSLNRLHTALYYQDGKLVRFFFAWQCLDRAGDWVERYSVCTMHGYLHEHTTGHQKPDRRDVKALYSQTDVQDCHDKAYDMVLERFQFASGGPYG